MRSWAVIVSLLIAVIVLVRCVKDVGIADTSLTDVKQGPTPFHLKIPPGFPDYFLKEENRLTEEGIALGKRLFFDPILSRNENISCSSCHLQSSSFSDPRVKSLGTTGEETAFHSMPIFNIAWMNEFFWNGRAKSREAQALLPVTNPVEMNMTWPEVEVRLQNHPDYPELFDAAFGTDQIDSFLVAQAMVQYEMTLISSNSRFDRALRGEIALTEQEQIGQIIFNSEQADCFHCHGGVLTTDNSFHNNGLDDDMHLPLGLMEVTGKEEDLGKFKTPTLRNLIFTAPYMHDGRFQTLGEVVDFYSEGVHDNRNVDVLMEFAYKGGVEMNAEEKEALIAFLRTMTDASFVEDESLVPALDD
ncbi:MAG: cytochrome-c peroxidase [Flavobacteriales bacterium]|nr:cytochrome-c peroxidase [Flavobacteriales bacterium]